jgi:YHS domain-containing protein
MTYIMVRLLLFILILYVLRRFLAALMGVKSRPSPGVNVPNESNQMVKDPVCGMYLDSRLAVRMENRKGTFYFCSEGCKDKFKGISPGAGIDSAASR